MVEFNPSLPLATAADCKGANKDGIKKTYYKGKGIESELKCQDGDPKYIALFDRKGDKTVSQVLDPNGVKATYLFKNGQAEAAFRRF